MSTLALPKSGQGEHLGDGASGFGLEEATMGKDIFAGGKGLQTGTGDITTRSRSNLVLTSFFGVDGGFREAIHGAGSEPMEELAGGEEKYFLLGKQLAGDHLGSRA
ncbi:unnamed protein product [Arabis nemorensis]|uniref:Uncharacterized protein n=1 Tax=Arabis nemorensis TaxID=586526 RepID=A0A565AX04_9BRAS|nr:unnamed protein product [Arabis nemorensis]